MFRKITNSPIGKLAAWSLAIFTSTSLIAALVYGTKGEEDLLDEEPEEELLKEKADLWGVSVWEAQRMDKALRDLDKRTDRLFYNLAFPVVDPTEALHLSYEELLKDISQHKPADEEAELLGKIKESFEAYIEEKKWPAGAGKSPTLRF